MYSHYLWIRLRIHGHPFSLSFYPLFWTNCRGSSFASRSSHLQCSSLNRTFPSSEPLAHSLASTNHDRSVATQSNLPHFCQATSGLKARACNGPGNAKFGHQDIRSSNLYQNLHPATHPPSGLHHLSWRRTKVTTFPDLGIPPWLRICSKNLLWKLSWDHDAPSAG